MNVQPVALTILVCTGSIGDTTFRVLENLGADNFRVVALSGGRQLDKLIACAERWKPRLVCVAHSNDEAYVRSVLPPEIGVLSGVKGLCEISTFDDVEIVLNGLVGGVGLLPTHAALCAGKTVGMANKEPLVMAGGILREAAMAHGGEMLPLDSEPNAIWQCLQGKDKTRPKRVILTASGGPFRGKSREEMRMVTPRQALDHPTWSMGSKITVDSATLMNKGCEVIESHWLFSVPFDQIDGVVHPQSVIHSMVEFADGSVKAQMGPPDMRLPIQYSMAYPERIASSVIPRFDPLKYAELTFEELNFERYPCFTTAVEAGRKGQTYPAVLSAADEEAVHLFLDGLIGFNDIHGLVSDVLDKHEPIATLSLESILEADAWAREQIGSSF